MPKRLILTRHAKSNWEVTASDIDRPLNKRGQEAAPRIGNWLRENHFEPQEIHSSTARRTRETCQALGFDAPVKLHESLYHASTDTILQVLRRADKDCVLLVGHNPGIAEFAQTIVRRRPAHPRFDDYPTCATCVIDFDISLWSHLRFQTGLCVDFAIPRDLPS